jgi:hypothetical protein
MIKNNSPMVKFRCGIWEGETTPLKIIGDSGQWNDLEWVFPLTERLVLDASVWSNKVFVGFVSFATTDLLEFVKDESDSQEAIRHIVNGTNITGTIRIRYTMTPERESSLDFNFPDLMLPLKIGQAPQPLADYGSLTFHIKKTGN